jgi:hypothetical protein
MLYVPSLSKNFISFSCLADDGYECLFGVEQCLIKFNKICMSLAFRQNKLDILSMHDDLYAMRMCVRLKKVSSSTNVS